MAKKKVSKTSTAKKKVVIKRLPSRTKAPEISKTTIANIDKQAKSIFREQPWHEHAKKPVIPQPAIKEMSSGLINIYGKAAKANANQLERIDFLIRELPKFDLIVASPSNKLLLQPLGNVKELIPILQRMENIAVLSAGKRGIANQYKNSLKNGNTKVEIKEHGAKLELYKSNLVELVRRGGYQAAVTLRTALQTLLLQTGAYSRGSF